MKTLTRTLYVSRVSDMASLELAATVRDVLHTSRANNARAGVTGMLLTFRGYFVQALEGEDHAVKATLARVARDPRHTELQVLGSDFTTARAFGRWAMCANDLSAADDQILQVLEDRGRFQPYRMDAGAALKLLRSIAAIHARQKDLAADAGALQAAG